MDDEEYTSAILEVLLDTLEPNPSDRPTAKDLLSYRLFSLIEDERDNPDTQAILDKTHILIEIEPNVTNSALSAFLITSPKSPSDLAVN